MRRTVVLTAVAVLALTALATPAAGKGKPGGGGGGAGGGGTTPGYVVSVGDSYISGEAGRWAGNTNDGEWRHDALGPSAYLDAGTRESIPGCHRASSAEIHIGGGVPSLNLACSGARTATRWSGSDFKPGLDFYDDGNGNVGQAKALERFVGAGNDVDMVVVSIGGNDFGFADIVQNCVTDFLLSPSWWPDYCKDDSSVTQYFTSTRVAANTAAIAGAIANVNAALAGDTDGQHTIVVQTYPSPIPRGSGFRYSQSGYTRQSTGGCGFWNADADWANDVALPTINGAVRSGAVTSGVANVAILELEHTFVGRRLCEQGVGLLEEMRLSSWTSRGAVDKTEWINQIRTVSTVLGSYQVQESFHPNYWGQLAVRSCVRQAFNGGSPRGGTCSIAGTGLAGGEPKMTLG